VAGLHASLTETTTRFPVLATRLVHLSAATGDVTIICADGGGGVRFLVVDMGDVNATRPAGDEYHDMEAFPRPVPELQAGELPTEAMAVQVTRLHGGVALSVVMHHAVVDD
jgi:hypothetical protein